MLLQNYTSEHHEEHNGVQIHGNTFLVEDEGYSLGSALRFLLNKKCVHLRRFWPAMHPLMC